VTRSSLKSETTRVSTFLTPPLIRDIVLPLYASVSPTEYDPPDAKVIQSSSIALEALATVEQFPVTLWLDSPDVIEILLNFIESARSPQKVSDGTGLDEEEDAEKLLGTAKASIIRCIVELSSQSALEEQRLRAFWDRMRAWLSSADREDMVACALLAIGNGARTGELPEELS
jgi:hypothetical protein